MHLNIGPGKPYLHVPKMLALETTAVSNSKERQRAFRRKTSKLGERGKASQVALF